MTANLLEIGGKKFDLTKMNPNSTITVRGHRIKVKDIPYDVYTLKCGHIGRAFGAETGDIMFCDSCHDDKEVVRVKR